MVSFSFEMPIPINRSPLEKVYHVFQGQQKWEALLQHVQCASYTDFYRFGGAADFDTMSCCLMVRRVQLVAHHFRVKSERNVHELVVGTLRSVEFCVSYLHRGIKYKAFTIKSINRFSLNRKCMRKQSRG